MYLSNFTLDLLGTLLVDIVLIYAWTKLLHMRSNRVFCVILTAYFILMLLTRNLVGPGMRVAYLLAGYVMVPFLCSDDPPARKLLVIALYNAAVMAGEALGGAVWIALTGTPVADYDAVRAHLDVFCLVHTLHIVIISALMYGIYAFLNRRGRTMGRELRFFVGFPVTQAVLLTIPSVIAAYLHEGSSVLYYGTCVLLLVCLAADVLLFRSMAQLAEKRREDQRVLLLQGQLDEYLARYNHVVSEVEEAAKLRHDARNQVQTVLALADADAFDQAREHLAELRNLVESEGEDATVANEASVVTGMRECDSALGYANASSAASITPGAACDSNASGGGGLSKPFPCEEEAVDERCLS